MTEVETFARLGLALALGLLIGLERGWQGREAAEHSRVAGIRTFGLIGFGGGLAALLFPPAWSINFGLAFAAVAIVIASGHYVAAQRTGDLSATSAIAALATFILGASAVAGSAEVAASAAVIIALLLSIKPILHGWLQRIEFEELLAALQLLLISVVALPLLPNRGFGPWQALNPFEIWWMVVLIAAFSFCGYLAMRIVGPARGTMITAILGGLTSSTAVTVSLARLARRNPGRDDLLAAGAAVASGTMFLRTMALLAVLNLPLLLTLAAPLGAAAAVTYGGGFWLVAAVQGGRDGGRAQAGQSVRALDGGEVRRLSCRSHGRCPGRRELDWTPGRAGGGGAVGPCRCGCDQSVHGAACRCGADTGNRRPGNRRGHPRKLGRKGRSRGRRRHARHGIPTAGDFCRRNGWRRYRRYSPANAAFLATARLRRARRFMPNNRSSLSARERRS